METEKRHSVLVTRGYGLLVSTAELQERKKKQTVSAQWISDVVVLLLLLLFMKNTNT